MLAVSPNQWPAWVAMKFSELERQRETRRPDAGSPIILSVDETEQLRKSVLRRQTPWRQQPMPSCRIPGAISDEECRYYVYLGRFYSGRGKAVELGPWLGRSTFYIVEGLRHNRRFDDEKLHVFDDFVWRGLWMDAALLRVEKSGQDRPPDFESFRYLFERYTRGFDRHLVVEQCRFSAAFGNERIPPLRWDNGEIEICYVDCGRTCEQNDAWWSILRDSFIPNRTLVILQDWQTHKEVPVKWYNQMKQFTDSKSTDLELVHELRFGTAATFLYRGRQPTKRRDLRAVEKRRSD